MYRHPSQRLSVPRRTPQTPLATSQPRHLLTIILLALTVLVSGLSSLGCRSPEDDLLRLPGERTPMTAPAGAAGPC